MKKSESTTTLVGERPDLEKGLGHECDECDNWDRELESARLIIKRRNSHKCTVKWCIGMTIALVVIGFIMGWVLETH